MVAKGEGQGEGFVGSLGWISSKSYCIAYGTVLNAIWQPGWERV